MVVEIVQESPDRPDATALIIELDDILIPLYPPEDHHGFDVEKLVAERVPFFVIRVDGALAGCGGIKLFGTEYGEVKRMYVRAQYRAMGLGKLMLQHLERYARQRGVRLLRLETGIYQREAIGLYERAGFVRVPPFGEYKLSPFSLFFEKPVA